MRRLYPEQPIVGVGAVILCEDHILLEKRKNDPGKGKWTIPGGLVELGENLENAIIREVEEETCLLCLKDENPTLVDVVDNIELDENGKVRYHFVIIDYLVKVKTNVFKASSDAEALRWVNFDDVEKYELTSSFREFFQRNRQKMATWQL